MSYEFTAPLYKEGKRDIPGEYLTAEDKDLYKSFWNTNRDYNSVQADSKSNTHRLLLELSRVFKTYGGIIAGSATSFAYLDGDIDQAHDIDVFFTDPFGFSRFVRTDGTTIIADMNGDRWLLDTETFNTYKENPEKCRYVLFKPFPNNRHKQNIQLNKMIFYKRPVDVLYSFDLTCCKTALFGDVLYMDIQGVEDLANMELYATGVWHLGNFLHRVSKYRMRGFTWPGFAQMPKFTENEVTKKMKERNILAPNNKGLFSGLKQENNIQQQFDLEEAARYAGFRSYAEMKASGAI